jgi:hypothetical protein
MVDTSEAGFMGTPYYSARVHTDYRDATEIATGGGSARGKGIAFPMDGVIFMSDANERRFTLCIIQEPTLGFGLLNSAAAAERRGWTVEWMGVQPVSGCEPGIDARRIFDRAGLNRAKL